MREVERERARGREKGLEEKSLKNKKGVEIQWAKLKLRLGLCSCFDAMFGYVNLMIIKLLMLMQCLGMWKVFCSKLVRY